VLVLIKSDQLCQNRSALSQQTYITNVTNIVGEIQTWQLDATFSNKQTYIVERLQHVHANWHL